MRSVILFCLAVLLGFGAVAEAQTPDYYVTSTISSGGSGTLGSPWAWSTFVTQANTGTLCGKYVEVLDDGVYRNAGATISATCTAGNLLRIVGAATRPDFSGMRQALPTSGWIKTAGATNVWETTFSAFTVSTIAESEGHPQWVNQTVLDENGTEDVTFTLTFPPRYKKQTSIATVDAQYGSWWVNGTTLYVHTYQSNEPTTQALWATSTGYGGITLSGTYITVERIRLVWNSSESTGIAGRGLYSTGANNQLLDIQAEDSIVWATGNSDIVDGVVARNNIWQGNPSVGCKNPNLAVGECWNDSGSNTTFILGRTDGTTIGAIARNVTVTQCWNSISLYGAVTLEDSEVWGCPNHGIQLGGAGGQTIQRVIVTNAQEGVYVNDVAITNVTIKHSIFKGDSISMINAGTGWIITDNIVQVTFICATCSVTTLNYNLYIPISAGARIITYGGTNYTSLATFQAATVYEDNGLFLTTDKWFDGTQFVDFTAPADSTRNFRSVSGAAAIDTGSGGSDIGPYTFGGSTIITSNRRRMLPRGSAGGGGGGGGTIVTISAGTYTMAEVLALSPGGGTAGNVKTFQPAAGASVTIKGGGNINVNYVTLNGATGANNQLLIDGNLNPAATCSPTPCGSTQALTVSGSNVIVKYVEMKGPQSFHYGYVVTGSGLGVDGDNIPGDESIGYQNNGALFVSTGSPVTLDHVWAHSQYTFLGTSTGTLTVSNSLISNVFAMGTFSGDSYTIDTSVLWHFPNHGANFARVTSGGSYTMNNTLYVLSQEGPQLNQSDTPPTWGADFFTFTHNTIIQPDLPVSWSSVSGYSMDGLGIDGADPAVDGARVGVTIRDNVVRLFNKRVHILDETQYSFTTEDYNLWYTTHLTPFRTTTGGFDGVQTARTFAQWKTATGKDANSLFADPVFVSPTALTDPQPNPGNAANSWGHYLPTGTTITDKLNALRAKYVLANTSQGYNAASDGRSMGIY